MAIAPKKRGGAAKPFASSPVETAWAPILEALENYDGQIVARLMVDAAASSIGVWNACRMRMDAWIEQWFRDRGFGIDRNFPGEDFSAEAVVAFRHRIFPENPILTGDKIPRFLTELRLMAAVDAGQIATFVPAPTPAKVRGAIGRVVPGNLYEAEGGSE